jgi:hypothetical protein
VSRIDCYHHNRVLPPRNFASADNISTLFKNAISDFKYGKELGPWDVKARRHKAPDPRPLYNQPGIVTASQVVLVEGEKCADALIAQGICATTALSALPTIIF